MSRGTFLALSFLISLAACQKNPNNTESKTSCTHYDQVDKEMLDLINKIEQKYAGEKRFIDRLTEAQVYWVQYRDRQVRALFPRDVKDYKKEHGESYFVCKCDELIRLTNLRIAELNRWMEGSSDCPNSIR
ncbi:lysozyme inhibitor LprI family protein [Marinoscillum furvescens]|uniref:Uncharacterized protein DUF1311 n=1 Tax=Marinoscillum furvescens DSM 4134 TaxID=1122208 RepID=A0A3D9L6Y0_MARFU|nr:lysozyme inhibitor LprI family protein [Marinoscillum furvescens]REE00481.1 uncharacterized protein DUF1311 [Marinoscillum furvescens DSM 4134]